jgi:hypothetical protein
MALKTLSSSTAGLPYNRDILSTTGAISISVRIKTA